MSVVFGGHPSNTITVNLEIYLFSSIFGLYVPNFLVFSVMCACPVREPQVFPQLIEATMESDLVGNCFLKSMELCPFQVFLRLEYKNFFSALFLPKENVP